MAWRSIIISQPARLSLAHAQLVVEQGSQATRVPIEDIVVVVLETPQATITSALLSSLAASDVALLTCDEKHHPNGVLVPYLPHSRQLRILRRQLALSEPQKKRAWRTIVQAKLKNQATCLDDHGMRDGDYLRNLASRVRSGDPDNYEAQGARRYFPALFGEGFSREYDGWKNSALNYGYAILRAAIARTLVIYGFLLVLGLHHRSELNAFNLADDIIEVFRPFVDTWVTEQSSPEPADLSPKHKAALVSLLYEDVSMPAGHMNILSAITAVVEGLARMIETGNASELQLPELIARV